VGEHRPTDDVTDGVDARRLRPEVTIREDEAAPVDLDPRGLEPKPVRVRPTTGGEQHAVAADRLLPVDLDDAALSLAPRGGHLRAEPELDALLGEQLLRLAGDLRVHAGQD